MCRCATISTVLAVLLFGSGAAAQPDPFEDYDRWKEGEEEPAGAAPVGVAVVEPAAPWAGFDVGTISVGGRVQLAYTGTSNDVPGGGEESHNTYFLRLTPTVGYTVIDRVHLALSLGILSKSVSQAQGHDDDETNFFTEAAGYYTIPLGTRFAFVPGIGLGFYLGSGSRDLEITKNGRTSIVQESTTTSGFSAAVYFGLGFAVTKEWQIRSGLSLNALLGSESIDSSGESLGSSAAHIGLPIEIYYAF